MMVYRVVQRGKHYQCQYRFAFFWWLDSGYPACGLEEAVDFAQFAGKKGQRVVWPA